jgi:hypothetical protein
MALHPQNRRPNHRGPGGSAGGVYDRRGARTLPPGGTTWDVYLDGTALLGYIERLDGVYRVNLGGMRGMPWPPFATLDDAVPALVEYHAGGRR